MVGIGGVGGGGCRLKGKRYYFLSSRQLERGQGGGGDWLQVLSVLFQPCLTTEVLTGSEGKQKEGFLRIHSIRKEASAYTQFHPFTPIRGQ